jgi:transcriptional regulator with PAS, ATPase and Fis domain
LEPKAVLAEESDHDSERLQLELQNAVSPGALIGTSKPMRAVRELISKAVDRDFPVLISGETGTGKELVSRCIHDSGPRKNRPFVPVDCSSLTPTLFESELFGHVRGAFTGAAAHKEGLFEAANTGTLFLDEIGELQKEQQAKLLRAVQEREVRPVGSIVARRLDVRIVAATNRDVKQAAVDGTFRRDLYYRLSVFPIALPPLRDRKDDIPQLVTAFLGKHADPSRPITDIGEDFWRKAMGHCWPGNVRELENYVARCIALGSGPTLRDEDHCRILARTGVNMLNMLGSEPLKVTEQRAILKALEDTGGDRQATARILGIGKTTLYRRLKEYLEVRERAAEEG